MICSNCRSQKLFPSKREKASWLNALPWRLLVECVRCDTCLMKYYRVRGLGLLICRGVGNCVPFL